MVYLVANVYNSLKFDKLELLVLALVNNIQIKLYCQNNQTFLFLYFHFESILNMLVCYVAHYLAVVAHWFMPIFAF